MDALMVKHKTSHREKRMLSFLTKVGIFFFFFERSYSFHCCSRPNLLNAGGKNIAKSSRKKNPKVPTKKREKKKLENYTIVGTQGLLLWGRVSAAREGQKRR